MKSEGSKKTLLRSENVNLLIAICAILVSAASFYATFLQADSAEKQVRAMTLPLLHFDHNNYNEERNQVAIDFTLKNSGVGPAIVHTMELVYEDKHYPDVTSFFKACCTAEYEEYEKQMANQSPSDIVLALEEGGLLTDSFTDIILAGQSDYLFMQLYDGVYSSVFWDKLDQQRWKLSLNICYCTLLDDCFETEGGSVITEVNSCPTL